MDGNGKRATDRGSSCLRQCLAIVLGQASDPEAAGASGWSPLVYSDLRHPKKTKEEEQVWVSY